MLTFKSTIELPSDYFSCCGASRLITSTLYLLCSIFTTSNTCSLALPSSSSLSENSITLGLSCYNSGYSSIFCSCSSWMSGFVGCPWRLPLLVGSSFSPEKFSCYLSNVLVSVREPEFFWRDARLSERRLDGVLILSSSLSTSILLWLSWIIFWMFN